MYLTFGSQSSKLVDNHSGCIHCEIVEKCRSACDLRDNLIILFYTHVLLGFVLDRLGNLSSVSS